MGHEGVIGHYVGVGGIGYKDEFAGWEGLDDGLEEGEADVEGRGDVGEV